MFTCLDFLFSSLKDFFIFLSFFFFFFFFNANKRLESQVRRLCSGPSQVLLWQWADLLLSPTVWSPNRFGLSCRSTSLHSPPFVSFSRTLYPTESRDPLPSLNLNRTPPSPHADVLVKTETRVFITSVKLTSLVSGNSLYILLQVSVRCAIANTGPRSTPALSRTAGCQPKTWPE